MTRLQELLGVCADAVLRPSDGADIPCSLFTCLASCSVIRELHDGVALDTTPCGKTVIPVPGVPADTLARTAAVIHGLTLVRDLSLADLEVVFAGMAVLGCDGLDDALLDRLWTLVHDSKSLKTLKAHADRLFQSRAYRMDAARMALRLAPRWTPFLEFLKGIQMDVHVALFVGKVAATFFPPAIVVRAIVDALPAASATQDTVLRLAGLRDAGSCYHPAEMEDLLAILVDIFSTKRWDPVLREVFAAMLEAHRSYVVAPVSAASLWGSAIIYESACTASVFLKCPHPITRMRSSARVTPWLKTQVHFGSGRLSLWIETWRLPVRPPRDSPRGFQLRVFVASSDSVEDVWYVWDAVATPAAAALSLANVSRIVGDPQDLHRVIRRAVEGQAMVKSLRFDLFYEPYSALDEPTLV